MVITWVDVSDDDDDDDDDDKDNDSTSWQLGNGVFLSTARLSVVGE